MATEANNWDRIISQAIRQRIEEIVAEEGYRAAERVRQRVGDELATITMAVLKQFDVSTDRGEILIRVRNELRG